MKPILIIDGYNVIYKSSAWAKETQRNLEAVREKLVQRVSSLFGYKKFKIVIVFDGRAEFTDQKIEYPHVTVRFSRHPETADDIINKLIRACKTPRQTTVVSSDAKDIGVVAKAHGVTLLRSEEFMTMLDKVKVSSIKDSGANNRKLSTDEIEGWLDFLGIGKNEAESK
jgi:predicted RNA-binding protein with PIN domain